MRPIRIMHVLDNLGRGGMQNGLVNLIHHLDSGRFEHVVCCTRYLADEQSHHFPADRVRVMCVGHREGSSRFQMAALARAIAECSPDIVHSRNWGGVEAVLAGRWAGSVALVHSEHGLDPETVTAEPWRRVVFRRLAFFLADRVLCVSAQLRDLYSRRTGFPEKRIAVIHNGVDCRKFFPDPASRLLLRRELGISSSEFCIGCVGRLSPIKDYPAVLHAVGELDQKNKNWRLIVVGEGPERPHLDGILRQHPAWANKVTLLGLSDRINQLLNAMDVYVLSSITEGISNSLLEAMAAGLPVIATSTGGNPEVVTDGESGILFPVGDAGRLATHLAGLQARPEARVQFGLQAVERIRRKFSLESMVSSYENLYLSLAPHPKLRPDAVACS
jgi:sugar transferase (PEP-CTERM/EpsH1 system associated)